MTTTKRYFRTMNEVYAYASELVNKFKLPITEVEGLAVCTNREKFILPRLKCGGIITAKQRKIFKKEGFETRDYYKKMNKANVKGYTVATYRK